MKKIVIITILMFLAFSSVSIVYGTDITSEEITQMTNTETMQDISGQLQDMTKKADNSVDKYIEKYGSLQYGWTAFILNGIRIYSIPVCFLGIIVSAIYQYIIGLKRLDIKEKGLAMMVGFITLLVICQIIPLVFAVVVLGWRG